MGNGIVCPILTEPMNGTEADEADSVVLEIVIPSPVPLPGHFRTLSQAADDEQGQHGKAKDARHDGDHNRFGGL